MMADPCSTEPCRRAAAAVPWGLWLPLRAMLLARGAAYLVRRAAEWLWFASPKMADFGYSVQNLERAALRAIALQWVVGYGVLMAESAGLLRRRYGLALADIGWHARCGGRWLLAGAATGIANGLLMYRLVHWWLGHALPGWRYTGMFGPPVAWWLPVHLLCTAGLASVAEEIAFRGMLFPLLRGRLGTAAAVALTTAAFLVWHLPLPQFGPQATGIVSSGLICCLLVAASGSLLPAVVSHLSNNAFVLLWSYAFG